MPNCEKLVALVCSGVLGIFLLMTHARNEVWRSDLTLWQDAARKSPELPRAHLQLGVALHQRGRLVEALKEYRRADELARQRQWAFDDGRVAAGNMVSISNDLQRYDLAEWFFHQAVKNYGLDREIAGAGVVMYGRTGRYEEALGLADRALKELGESVSDYQRPFALGALVFNRGEILQRLGRCREAKEEWSRAKKLSPLTEFPKRDC